MDNNKKPSEPLEMKELLVRQLQLVGKESENAHGETLAALSSAAAELAQALALYDDAPIYYQRGSEQFHSMTVDEVPRHVFSSSESGTAGLHTIQAERYSGTSKTHYHAMDAADYPSLAENEAKFAYDHAIRMREQGEFERLAAEQDIRIEENP